MDRRANISLQLVFIFVALFSFFLITALTSSLYSQDDRELEALCHASIQLKARSALNLDVGGFDVSEIKFTPKACTTIDKDVKGDREQIMRQFSDLSARCWWQFNEGKYDEILDSTGDGIFETLGFENVENSCFVCYNALIKERRFSDGGGMITSDELLTYMHEENYPRFVNATYLEYIQTHGGPGGIVINGNIEPHRAYGVAFMAKNRADNEGNWWTAIKAGAGISLSVATGGVGGGVALLASAANDILADARSERDVSFILIDDLNTLEEQCFTGDLGGR